MAARRAPPAIGVVPIGFSRMGDFFGVYDDMKVIEYLEFFAAAYRINGMTRKKICDDVLELVDLGYKRDALVTSLSRGMTQRLGLARVLLHDPDVLLLDEPEGGLDERSLGILHDISSEWTSRNRSIVMTTHNHDLGNRWSDKVGILSNGILRTD